MGIPSSKPAKKQMLQRIRTFQQHLAEYRDLQPHHAAHLLALQHLPPESEEYGIALQGVLRFELVKRSLERTSRGWWGEGALSPVDGV
jgi:hypothetical protein